MLSAGQDHDLTCAEPLIEAVDPGSLIADKTFDADAFIAAVSDHSDIGPLFRLFAGDAIRRGVFRNVAELKTAIATSPERRNAEPNRFVWTAGAADTLHEVARGTASESGLRAASVASM